MVTIGDLAKAGQLGSSGDPWLNPDIAPTGNGTAGTAAADIAAATNQDTGLTPLTGFASQYSPELAKNAFQNPWSILPDVFKGISSSSPQYQALRDIGADPLTLYLISQGSQQLFPTDQAGQSANGAGNFINWLQNLYSNLGTVGGQGIDPGSLIKTIFGQSEFGDQSKNSLGMTLGAGDMSTQIRTLFNMLKDVSNSGMDPLSASGYQSAIQQAGDKYQNDMMKTTAGTDGPMNPSAWIAKTMPWLANR